MSASRHIDGPAGRLETLENQPAHGVPLRAAAVLGHPHPLHGGTLHTKVVYRAAKALASIGCAVLRFNFRGVGASAGRFAEGAGEQDDFRAALDHMAGRHPDVPLWAGGMSFGAWVALSAGARDERVEKLLGIAAPVDRYDFSILREASKAKYLIHGEHDEICPLSNAQALFEQLPPPKRLIVIPAANHLFTGREPLVGDAVASLFGGG